MKKQRPYKKRKTERAKDPLNREMSFVFDNTAKWKSFSDLIQFVPKDKTITLRMSTDLINRYKKLAKKKDMKYQKLIREALIEYLIKEAS